LPCRTGDSQAHHSAAELAGCCFAARPFRNTLLTVNGRDAASRPGSHGCAGRHQAALRVPRSTARAAHRTGSRSSDTPPSPSPPWLETLCTTSPRPSHRAGSLRGLAEQPDQVGPQFPKAGKLGVDLGQPLAQQRLSVAAGALAPIHDLQKGAGGQSGPQEAGQEVEGEGPDPAQRRPILLPDRRAQRQDALPLRALLGQGGLPQRHRQARLAVERARRFRRLGNWRVGIKARISHLKRGFGLRRTRLWRLGGARTWSGWGSSPTTCSP
jgi:hypothetical protein